MADGITYTASAADVAAELDYSEEWVRKTAAREGIGTMKGRERRYTRRDVAHLRGLANPDETRGRPRSR